MNSKEEWRCVITIFGYLYAIIHGVFKMEMWFAKNLAINQQVNKNPNMKAIIIMCVQYLTKINIIILISITYLIFLCLYQMSRKVLLYFLYTTGSVAYTYSYFGTGIGPVIISNLYCSGSENNILDCSHNKINALTSCGVGQIAGLVCLGKLYALV